jgi:hypothetical protein
MSVSAIINSKIVDLKHNPSALLNIISDPLKLPNFDPVNYSTAWHLLARMEDDCASIKSDPRFARFARATARKITTDWERERKFAARKINHPHRTKWLSRPCASILHSMAKMDVMTVHPSSEDESSDQPTDDVASSAASLDQSTSTPLPPPPTTPLHTSLHRILACITHRSPKLALHGSPSDIANLAYGFGKLLQGDGHLPLLPNLPSIDARPFFKIVDHRGTWLVETGKPREVSATFCAFAKLKDTPNCVRATTFFKAIDNGGERLVEEGGTRIAGNIMWALAKLNVVAPTFFFAVGKRGPQLVQDGKPGEVANLAWSFATFGLEAPSLLNAISARSKWLLTEGTTREIANVMWAFGKIDVDGEVDVDSFYAAVDKRGAWIVETGNMQDIANIARGFSDVGMHCPKFFDAVQQNSLKLVTEQQNVRGICNIALAMARLHIRADAFLDAVDQRGEFIIANGADQDIANAASALARKGKGKTFFNALDLRGPEYVQRILHLTNLI